jgi:hypothetical protein
MTVKAFAKEEGHVKSDDVTKDIAAYTGEAATQPGTPVVDDSYVSGGTTSSGTAGNTSTDNTNTETKEDGTVVTTTETTAEDGSVTTKVELTNEATGISAQVNVSKDATGAVTSADAKVVHVSSDKGAALSATLLAQITEAAGTKDVVITQETYDANGKIKNRIIVDAADLTAGNELAVLRYSLRTGKTFLANASTYTVGEDGSLTMDDLTKATYKVVTKSEAKAFSKQVRAAIKPAASKKSVTAGKRANFTFATGLDKTNVAKITYSTTKKSVATVSKSGKITARKAGKATVKAVVTLKDGTTKTVKMTITVKKAKK